MTEKHPHSECIKAMNKIQELHQNIKDIIDDGHPSEFGIMLERIRAENEEIANIIDKYHEFWFSTVPKQ